MKLSKSRFQQPARMELLPLIDVIFLLLIFFIFVMLKMTLQSSITVDLPQSIESRKQNEDSVTISISSNNQIFINEQSCTLQDVVKKVSYIEKETKRPILIRGDRQSDLGIALTVLQKLRLAGFKQVAFATEKDK